MKADELKRRLKASGFPEWETIHEISQMSDQWFRAIAGITVIRAGKLPPKLNEWIMNGNIGKVGALGQFVMFLGDRSDDALFVDSWNGFLAKDLAGRSQILREARAWSRSEEKRKGNLTEVEIAALDLDVEDVAQDVKALERIRNPKYLIYRSSRQLVSMLKQNGTHAECYYLERMMTEYFFRGESIVW